MYTIPRDNDRYIMELAYESRLDQDKLMIINQTRLYMHILTISDIVELGSPSRILSGITEPKSLRKSKWRWPNVKKIERSWISTWTSFINTIVRPCVNTHRLGRWIGKTNQRYGQRVYPKIESSSTKTIKNMYSIWKKGE